MVRRRLAVLAAAGTALLAAPAAAPAITPVDPELVVTPPTAALGSEVRIAGEGFVVFENCARRVVLRLVSAQNAVRIGVVRVRRDGGFAHTWTPEADEIGPGRWRVAARQRCESGEDGSTFFFRASDGLTLR